MRISLGSALLSAVLEAQPVRWLPWWESIRHAKSLTTQRIAALPAAEQAAWLHYLQRSERQLQDSRQQFITELRHAGSVKPLPVIPLITPEGGNANSRSA